MAIHEAAARGFALQAGAYARGRPDYPASLDACPGSETHAHVVAVEPVAAMRERLVAAHPLVEALEGSAEAIPLDDASVDAVVCAQAFHWFATPAAMAEIGRVSRPGGVLALIWNVRDESVPWVRALGAIVRPHEGDAPRFHSGDWRRVFPAAGFGPLEETRFPHTHVGTADAVIVDRFLSVSFIAALADAERASVERRLRELIANEPALAGRDEIVFPYETVAFRTVRDRDR